jgi:autophagy-related protein 101
LEERNRRQAALEGSLREVLMQVLQIVNEKKEHIPPVIHSDVASFPYEITIPK